MNFGSVEEIKQYILTHSQGAVADAREKVYDVLKQFVDKFYGEYSPVLYARTYQFYQALVKTEVIATGNGWKAEIYFDVGALDHSMKTLQGIGSWANKNWSEETILSTAMQGGAPHGGYAPAGGVGIWTSAIPVISSQAYDWLKQALIANGIPIH